MSPSDTDDLLVRYLGDNLQQATIRVIGLAIAVAAVAALIVRLIG